MLLRRIQDLLAGIYDLRVDCDVRDFLTCDRALLPRELQDSGTDEQLLVAAHDDELAMSLFLDPALLERLDATEGRLCLVTRRPAHRRHRLSATAPEPPDRDQHA